MKDKKQRDQAKRVEHYLSLRYPVVVRELAPEEGGGYIATIPLLGSSTFVADGETAEEALQALDRLRRHLIPILVERGVELPEPDEDEELAQQYSGNLVLRIPKSLHGRLARAAQREGCSINKLATELLATALERRQWTAELREWIEDELKRLLDERWNRLGAVAASRGADVWPARDRRSWQVATTESTADRYVAASRLAA